MEALVRLRKRGGRTRAAASTHQHLLHKTNAHTQPKIFATGDPRDLEVTYHPALVGGERNRFRDDGSREQVGLTQQTPAACLDCVTCSETT